MGPTLQNWYEAQYSRLTLEGATAKAHILKEAYHKTLTYEIHHTCMGYELTNETLIHRCSSIYANFCFLYRIP